MFRKEMSEFLGRNTTTARVKLQPEVLVARPDVAARVMNQMLQAEAVPLRKILVNHLKKMRNPSAVAGARSAGGLRAGGIGPACGGAGARRSAGL